MNDSALTDSDRLYLSRALELAELGLGRVSPNPLVGAVIVRDGEVIGEGHHAELGAAHAERAALESCRAGGGEVAGATIYVSLEPCAHHGRQPPCAEALIEAGIARVVYASEDPSAKAAGRGPALLREHGVTVQIADGEEGGLARAQNQPFRKHALTGLPLVTYKCAASLDGRTAAASGESRWISGPRSRRLVHRWRAQSDAVAVGIGTALADDPLLTARDLDPAERAPRQPARVVFDDEARLAPDAKVLAATADSAPVFVIVATERSDAGRLEALRERGARVIETEGERPRRLHEGLRRLGEAGITSLLVEGGASLAGALLAAGEIDELRLFCAPLLLGGDGPGIFEGPGVESVAAATVPLAVERETVGDDLLLKARIREF